MGNDTFAAAVGAIVESHKKLYALLLAAFESYKSGIIPPRAKRVSRILDCEANGAHTILENLASAAKAEQPNVRQQQDSQNRFFIYLNSP